MYGRIAAIVPTYNRKNLLIECIDGLLRQTVPVARVVVVDNASTDGTVEAVRERYAGIPSVEVHALPENTGASGGFHEAGRIALAVGCDWVWYTDDDSEPKPDALEVLLRTADDLRGKGIPVSALTSLKVGRDGVVQHKHTGRFTWRMVPLKPGECRGVVRVDYASFTGTLIARNALEEKGLNTPEYYLWGDDIEFSLRIGQSGGIFLVADSVVLHKDIASSPGETFAAANFWRYYFGIRNWVLLAGIHRGRWTLPLIYLACLYFIAANWARFERKRESARLILKAFRDGAANDLSDPVTQERWKEILAGAPF